ncbi:hypothetical protein HELRODRAFT_171469 [Helobdella robusta]|uniref:Ig-like domain-containing protein n=1 Tax=Helobdella robusta TaxID=6412 RepID=T1F4B8_HELRO|nr:hypothetical protein HELRODRAFT_171469 [Helobdella robusta]ESO05796.1 hypothetical protein HELRODRAFT_171469 [Helobdella robusta]
MTLIGRASHVQRFSSADRETRDFSAPAIGQIKISRQSVDNDRPNVHYLENLPKARHSSTETLRSSRPFRSLSVDRHVVHQPYDNFSINVGHSHFPRRTAENLNYDNVTFDMNRQHFSRLSSENLVHPKVNVKYKYIPKPSDDDLDDGYVATRLKNVSRPVVDMNNVKFAPSSNMKYIPLNNEYAPEYLGEIPEGLYSNDKFHTYKTNLKLFDGHVSPRHSPTKQSYYRQSPSPLKYDVESRSKIPRSTYPQHVPRFTHYRSSKNIFDEDSISDDTNMFFEPYKPKTLTKSYVAYDSVIPITPKPEMYSPFYSEVLPSRSYSHPHVTNFSSKILTNANRPKFEYKPSTIKEIVPKSTVLLAAVPHESNDMDIEDKIKEIKRKALGSKFSKGLPTGDYSNVHDFGDLNGPHLPYFHKKSEYKLLPEKYDLPRETLTTLPDYENIDYVEPFARLPLSDYEQKHITKEAHNKDLLMEAQKIFGPRHEQQDSVGKISDIYPPPPKTSFKKPPTREASLEFTSPLKPKKVKINENVRLSCAVSAVPEPNVSWFCNDKQIKISPRIQTSVKCF